VAGLPILMQEQHIEPFLFVPGHEHSHTIASKFEMHSLVLHIAYAIQAEASRPFSQQHWAYGDSGGRCIRVGHRQVNFAHVIDETRHRQDIKRAQCTFGACALRIVMVAVNGENGYAHIQVGVFVVDCGEALVTCRCKVIAQTRTIQHWTYVKPSAFPSNGSLNSSICTGLSLSVNSRNSAVVL
jgi:hypothetical protein